MKQVVLFDSEYGPVAVELDAQEAGPGPASRDVLAKAQVSLEEALDGVRSTALALRKKVAELGPSQPDEVQLAFGIKLSAGLAVVASAKAEASITVTVTWKDRLDRATPHADA